MVTTRRRIETFARKYLEDLCTVLRSVPLYDLVLAIEMLERAYAERRQVFLAGNGGSAATASHMAQDLVKGVARVSARGFHAIALLDNVPLITAIANDGSYSWCLAI
jgi:D-sedoheptulose 7-phosphate isomerase